MLLLVLLSLATAQTTFGPVKGLPGMPQNAHLEQYAGLVEINSTCPASLFAWLVKAKNGDPNAPVVLWSNGGPGSSSFLGWFFEQIGPLTIENDGKTLSENSLAWSGKVDLIMFDQPAGVGLSMYSKPECAPQNVFQSSSQWAAALEKLWAMPELGLAKKKIHLFGESYAGTYLPLLALALRENRITENTSIEVGGMGIGDGWVNPKLQQMTYSEMARTHGLVNGVTQMETVSRLQSNCQTAIESAPSGPIPASANTVCNLIEEFIVNVSNVNVYDVRTTDEYDFDFISDYLNQASVFKALNLPQNVSTNPWMAGSDLIGNLFAIGEQNSVSPEYDTLISSGLPMLFYNGVFDMDCGFLGTDAWLEASEWGVMHSLASVGREPWFVFGIQSGMYRSLDNVTQVVLANAGHLVPYNIGPEALEMMEQFVFKGKLISRVPRSIRKLKERLKFE